MRAAEVNRGPNYVGPPAPQALPGSAADAAALDTAPLDSAPQDSAPQDSAPLDSAPLDSAPLGSASATPAAVEGATTKSASAASAMPKARELIYVSPPSRPPPLTPNSRVLGRGRARSAPPIPLWRERGSEMGFRQSARLLANSDGTDMGPIWDRIPGIKPTL